MSQESAKTTVVFKKSGRSLRIEPQSLAAAIRISMAKLTTHVSVVQSANHFSKNGGEIDYQLASIASWDWEKSRLKRILDFQGLLTKWDSNLKAFLKGRRRWFKRHMLEYRQETNPEADKLYKQVITVEGQYRRVMEKYKKECQQRPWAQVEAKNRISDFQLEDTARALMKDRAFIGLQQGAGKSYVYGAIADVCSEQRRRSLAGQGRVSAKPFCLIVCEGKAVWDMRDMLKDLVGIDARILEKPGDENDPSIVHIISYDKLCYGSEKWKPAACLLHDMFPIWTDTQPFCRKCGQPIRYSIESQRRLRNAAGPKEKMQWAMRDLEVKMFSSGKHPDIYDHRVFANPAGVVTDQDRINYDDNENASKFPPGMIRRRHPWVKRLAKRYSLIQADESFSIQNIDSLRTQAFMQLRPKRRRYIGTGTLLDGTANDAYSQFGWCFGFRNPLMPFPPRTAGLKSFEARFCQWVDKTSSSGAKSRALVNKHEPKDLKNWYRFLFPKMIRRTATGKIAAQMGLTGQPDHRLVEVLMDDADRMNYCYYLDAFSQEFAKMQQEAIENRQLLSAMQVKSKMWALRAATTCPQSPRMTAFHKYTQATSTKQRMLLHLVEGYLEQHEKVVVFTGIVDACEILAGILDKSGIRSRVLSGKQPPKKRQKLIAEWKASPEIEVLICSTQAEKTARTFTQANHVIFIDLEWSPLAVEQAWKRVHRRGQTKPVTVDYICCAGTIDQIVYEEVLRKQAATNLAIDRREESDYAHSKIDALEIALKVLATKGMFEAEMRRLRETDFGYVEGQPEQQLMFREVRKEIIA